jgi:hypothetical protein
LRFICLAGEARVISRQKNLLVDRQEFIYQGIVRALGYGKNKENFRRLAREISWAQLRSRLKKIPLEKWPLFIQAIFFQAGGLFPQEFTDEETRIYTARLKDILRDNFRDCPKNVVGEWNLKNCRPANYPWRRIAGFSHLVCRLTGLDWENLLGCWIEQIVRATDHGSDRKHLLAAWDFLVEWFYQPAVQKDYFARRYQWGKESAGKFPALLGRNRAASIVINVFLPAALYWARNDNDEKLENSLWDFYYKLPLLEPNRRAKKIWNQVLPAGFVRSGQKNFLFNREILNQGWLQIADDFCSKTTCARCVLPTILRRKLIDPEFY